MPVVPLIGLLVGLVVVAAVILLSRRADRLRTEAMNQASGAMGFVFEARGDPETVVAAGGLPLFGRGHSKRLKNVMTGRVGDRDVRLFDYQYTTGGGKESHTWRQTVALYLRGGEGLPDFALAPEHVFHKIGQVFGYQDIDFDSNPEFSSHYLLRGPDEMAIRSAFGSDVVSFFEQQRGWTVEVRAGTVGIYRSGKRSKPEDVRTFLEETQAVLRAMAHR